jgi:hypothetical protein
VYKKLANDLEIVPRVLMTMATEGSGEIRYYCSVILDDEIVHVVVVNSTIIAVAVLLLRILRRGDMVIIFARLLAARLRDLPSKLFL